MHAAWQAYFEGMRNKPVRSVIALVAVVVALAVLFVVVRQSNWNRECERRVPAYDHNEMDACKDYGPGVLPANSYRVED